MQDTTENIVFDGSTIPISTAGTGTTTTNELDWTVTRSSTTSTLAFDADGGSFTTAELVTALDAATYTNTDQSPTAGARVITITLLEDEGSSSSPHDNSANSGLAQASTVTVAAANDLPTTGDQTKTILEDATYTAASGDFTFADVDGDSITHIKITTLETVGALKNNNVDVTLNEEIAIGDIGDLTFDPVADASGSTYATFQFKVKDGTAYSTDPGTMTIAVTAVNDAPVVSGGNTGTATESTDNTDDTETGTLTSTDTESGTRTWCIQSVTESGGTCSATGTYGSIVITASSGAWTYTLDQDDAQTDALDGGDSVSETFTVVVTDNGGTDNGGDDDGTATLTITIAGADDAPTTSTPSTQSGTEDTTFTGYAVCLLYTSDAADE